MWEATLGTRPDPNTKPCWSFSPMLEIGMVAQSTDNLDSSGESGTRSVGSTANLKGKMSKRLSVVKGHFPKLVDCAHFHYENVDFGSIELQFATEQSDASWTTGSAKDLVFLVQVSCQGKTWVVRRSYEEFRTLDAHLHQCIYDRRYSQLLALPALCEIGDRAEILTPLLSEYLNRLSMIVDNKLNCGPVLTWMEIDNHGNRFLLKEEASLNVPAIAAAHVIKRYTAQASDEISIEVGDILSVIDMPPKEDTTWWRGKHGFQVGFFPSECVELINERLQQSAPVSKQDGDLISSKPGTTSATGPSSPTSVLPPWFLSLAVSKKHGKLMGFLRTFMKSRPTKQKLKQRGILKERVLKSCSEFIEKHGVVDGIYRHSGVSSNIQKLRHEFDSENVPDLTKDVYMQDIHCVGSLCKLSKEIEATGLSGADPFKEVRIQSVVVEFLLSNVEVLFSDSFTSVGRFSAATGEVELKISRQPRTRLVSLQEARAESGLTEPTDLDAELRRYSMI
ncbi:hypothetical protein DNTS_005487 [Danionella cerebrum]|uniref:SH3 domain-containing protein n=1 Tax=Danionella cerebrum TaxID=2873325 RepID=A0A553PYG8_9TELE|nr:hypothetical protein DNTS_005487 [Danionella translucida]